MIDDVDAGLAWPPQTAAEVDVNRLRVFTALRVSDLVLC
jgi:hypothetical protein